MKISILPSLLASDFSRLDREIERVEDAGADMLHVDVMDGVFVPNITIGPFIVEAIKRCSSIPLDVHLMITNPGSHAKSFVDAGADRLSFHIEAEYGAPALSHEIRSMSALPGIAISPRTALTHIKPYLSEFNHVLVMTVEPGFGGQKLITDCVDKVRALREDNGDLPISVDGGINADTIPSVASAGANEFIAGTAIFKADDPAAVIQQFRRLARQA